MPNGTRKAQTATYLARHGQTSSNLVGRYAGWTNEGLTAVGRKQVSALATRLGGMGVAEIWSSEITRALQTAHVIGKRLGCGVRIDSRLNELRMGRWEGLTETEV